MDPGNFLSFGGCQIREKIWKYCKTYSAGFSTLKWMEKQIKKYL